MPKPQLALLTSFCFEGLKESAKLLRDLDTWPGMPEGVCRNVEIYAAMQSDVDGVMEPFKSSVAGSRPRDALQLLAHLRRPIGFN